MTGMPRSGQARAAEAVWLTKTVGEVNGGSCNVCERIHTVRSGSWPLYAVPAFAQKLMLAHVAVNPAQSMMLLAKDSGMLAKYGFTAEVLLIPGTPRTIKRCSPAIWITSPPARRRRSSARPGRRRGRSFDSCQFLSPARLCST